MQFNMYQPTLGNQEENCHAEYNEASRLANEILRFAQDDKQRDCQGDKQRDCQGDKQRDRQGDK